MYDAFPGTGVHSFKQAAVTPDAAQGAFGSSKFRVVTQASLDGPTDGGISSRAIIRVAMAVPKSPVASRFKRVNDFIT
jgi:hypothetical protein